MADTQPKHCPNHYCYEGLVAYEPNESRAAPAIDCRHPDCPWRVSAGCVPLCAASKAYGRFDKPWKHEPQCPVRIEWEAARSGGHTT